MICVSLSELSIRECLSVLRDVRFAEIRMETMDLDLEDILKIFSSHPRLIAACRPGTYSREDRLKRLSAAVGAGAAYVDIEWDADEDYRNELIKEARSKSCAVIMSFHDFVKTPPKKELQAVVETCFNTGADIAKIACSTLSEKDCARLLGLLDDPRKLVVIGMGKIGKITRIAAPLLGSLFTYAAWKPGMETAPGQLDKDELESILQKFKNA